MWKILKPDYEKTSWELGHWFQIHAEMLHEWTYQIFRTWILKDWKRKWDIKTLHLKWRYNPEEYVNSFIKEYEEKI